MNNKSLMKILLNVARILSVIVIGFIVFMFLGNIFSSGNGAQFKTIELIAGIFFPIGLVIGLVLAWKNELIGGLIAVISMVIFSCLILIPRGVNLERGSWMFMLIALPGVLFAIYGFMGRMRK